MVMYQGEIRNLGISVANIVESTFTITEAKYAVVDSNNVVLLNGDATIDSHNIYTLFSADNVGKYTLVFIYKVGVETLKAKLYIEVNE